MYIVTNVALEEINEVTFEYCINNISPIRTNFELG